LARLLAAKNRSAVDIAAREWPDDQVTPIVLRAATAPATLTTSGWASQLAVTAIPDFIGLMGPASAGSLLLQRGLSLTFDGNGGILVPGAVAGGTMASFVAEGAPIPVRQLAISAATLTQKRWRSFRASRTRF